LEESTTIQRARAEIQSLRATLREREAAAQGLLQRADSAASENDALAEQLSELAAREVRLEADLELARNAEKAARDALAASGAAISSTDMMLQARQEAYDEASEQATELEGSLALLQRELEEVRGAL
jgi:chromosome segregation ATPase